MSERSTVTFEVVAADSGTELFLIDGDFRLIKKGIGRETFSVPPGIYKIKARGGRTTTERLVSVREGMGIVNLDPLRLSSAMPLRNSAKTHEFHMQAARQAAATPNLTVGSGSAIVVVARQWTMENPPPPSTALLQNPARGLLLRDTSGAVIADIEQLTRVDGTFDPCVTLHITLNPGAYRLTLDLGDGRRVEQTLMACAGWQTHIYTLLAGNADEPEARPDLTNSAVTIRSPAEGFDPDDPKLRLEEIARGALYDGRRILSEDIRSQITDAGASPMFALLGAQLLIREMTDAKNSDPKKKVAVDNRASLRKIVENLRVMIGAQPDVEAIAISTGNADPTFTCVAPPMCRLSWGLLLQASVQNPNLIPPSSFVARVAERIWGEGPWLLWLDPDTSEAADRSALWQAKARELLLSLYLKQVATPSHADVGLPGVAGAITPTSQTGIGDVVLPKLRSFFSRRSRTPFPGREGVKNVVPERAVMEKVDAEFKVIRSMLKDEDRQDLVDRLGVPMSSVDAWLDSLDR